MIDKKATYEVLKEEAEDIHNELEWMDIHIRELKGEAKDDKEMQALVKAHKGVLKAIATLNASYVPLFHKLPR